MAYFSIRHRLGFLFVLAFAYVFAAAQAKTAKQPVITTGPNVLVSRSRSDRFHWEVVTAADPTNPRNLLACSIAGEESREPHASVIADLSVDGGQSWQETLKISVDKDAVWDPTCAYDAGGAAYVGAANGGIFKSKDSGKTWIRLMDLPRIDRPFITIDNMKSPYRGRVYLSGKALIPLVDAEDKRVSVAELWRLSDTEAGYFGPARLASAGSNRILGPPGSGVVLSDGTYITLVGEFFLSNQELAIANQCSAPGRLLVLSSKDGGRRFDPPIPLADWCPDQGFGPLPMLATDTSSGPYQDRAYAVWSHMKSKKLIVLMTRSSDRGKTWSTPVVVSGNPSIDDSAADAFMPVVAVNSSGVVGILWYERSEQAGKFGYWPVFTASIDGGDTFLPRVKVSEAPASFQIPKLILSNPRPVRAFRGQLTAEIGFNGRQFSGGDTNGLTAGPDGIFHALWTDNRTGIAQVWTAPVNVAGKAIENAFAIPGLADVTDRVTLHLTDAVYDRERQVLAVEASLENISEGPLRAPLKIQLLSVTSRIGSIRVSNADKQTERGDSEWDLSQQLEKGLLLPRKRSQPKRIEFRLDQPLERAESPTDLMRLVNFKAKVWAAEAYFARFLGDVTPDGLTLAPGATATKTWRLKNIGTLNWVGIKLRFVLNAIHAGNKSQNIATNGVTEFSIPDTEVGKTVDVSLPITAPQTPGSYYTVWTLYGEKERLFKNWSMWTYIVVK